MIPSLLLFGAYRRRVLNSLGRRQDPFVGQAQDRRFRLDPEPSSPRCIDLQQVDRSKSMDSSVAFDEIRAMNSLRIEKSYCLIDTERSIEYTALESGLQRLRCEAWVGRSFS